MYLSDELISEKYVETHEIWRIAILLKLSDDYCSVGPPDSEHEGVTIKITAYSNT